QLRAAIVRVGDRASHSVVSRWTCTPDPAHPHLFVARASGCSNSRRSVSLPPSSGDVGAERVQAGNTSRLDTPTDNMPRPDAGHRGVEARPELLAPSEQDLRLATDLDPARHPVRDRSQVAHHDGHPWVARYIAKPLAPCDLFPGRGTTTFGAPPPA